MSIVTFRIRNKAAFAIEDFREFMVEVFSSDRLVKDPVKALAELAEGLHRESSGLFVVRDEDGWLGAIICQHGKTAFNPVCSVIHLHCDSDAIEVRNALVQAVYEFAIEGGYNEVIAVDTSNKPMDFSRALGAIGKPVEIGKIYKFDLEESLLWVE